ncbi:MAG: hypothetical protein WBB25_07860, partial [Sulfitobacter sp.]
MMCLAPIWTEKHETAKRLAKRIKTVLDVAAKLIDTTFVPVDAEYLQCFTAWMEYLRVEKLFGAPDAPFPKARTGFAETDGF